MKNWNEGGENKMLGSAFVHVACQKGHKCLSLITPKMVWILLGWCLFIYLSVLQEVKMKTLCH